jgi:hypothetical protein
MIRLTALPVGRPQDHTQKYRLTFSPNKVYYYMASTGGQPPKGRHDYSRD